ncbi:hypothetical protein MUK41_004184 [Vibrio vulnificus]|nr:hypothetical protein [Vibrio vulnificus]EIZ4627306.1 hypothetical protein [Vibrio vulnificus]EJB0301253.1 hypothetical protein [Vibrio vulnificus]
MDLNKVKEIIGQSATEQSQFSDKTKESELYEDCVATTATDETKKQEWKDASKQQASMFRERLAQFKSLHRLRLWAAIGVFILIVIWLVGVFILVFFGSYEVYYLSGNCGSYDLHEWHQKIRALPSGCHYLKRGNFLNLSEGIMITLIGTTTANVLGLSYIVANWLFPKNVNGNSDIALSGT